MSDEFARDEQQRLEDVAQWLRFDEGMNANSIRWCATQLISLSHGDSCLELGCADGAMTQILEQHFSRLVAVDGSQDYVQQTQARVSPQTRVIHSLFETLVLDEQFDVIILSHVLEHVADPVALLTLAQKWLKPGGVILVVVPNALSLHRQAAVYMGLLPHPEALNETDKRVGHRRVYRPETLHRDIEAAGLKVGRNGGIFLKILSNAQLEQQWTPEMIEAYYRLGFDYPELCAEIYAECLPAR